MHSQSNTYVLITQFCPMIISVVYPIQPIYCMFRQYLCLECNFRAKHSFFTQEYLVGRPSVTFLRSWLIMNGPLQCGQVSDMFCPMLPRGRNVCRITPKGQIKKDERLLLHSGELLRNIPKGHKGLIFQVFSSLSCPYEATKALKFKKTLFQL